MLARPSSLPAVAARCCNGLEGAVAALAVLAHSAGRSFRSRLPAVPLCAPAREGAPPRPQRPQLHRHRLPLHEEGKGLLEAGEATAATAAAGAPQRASAAARPLPPPGVASFLRTCRPAGRQPHSRLPLPLFELCQSAGPRQPARSPATIPLMLCRCAPRPYPSCTLAPPPLQEGCCAFGDHCPYAHNVFEYWLHPTRYRTQLCNDGSNCKRKICFFAHRCALGGRAARYCASPRHHLLTHPDLLAACAP